jgi:hypothetical protein
MNKAKFKSMTAFLDMLWILLAGFGAMFIIAYLLISPPEKPADIIKKAEYIVTLEWDKDHHDDIDLWVRSPQGITISFKNKSGGSMHLEKDDLGKANDTIKDEYGVAHILPINRETITLRGTVPGEYQVMIHVYSREFYSDHKSYRSGASPYKVEVIKLNPYKIVYVGEGVYTDKYQEISIVRFTVNKRGDFISFNNHPSDIIKSRGSGYDGNTTRTTTTGEQPRL